MTEVGETWKGKASLVAAGLCGILSPLLLVVATFLGGALRDGYDPMRDSISELYETGAPNAPWLMILFTTYHALVIPLAIGLHRGLPGLKSKRSWLGPMLLAIAGFFGVPLGSYARCDPGCFGATTFRGQLHGVLVLMTVALIFVAMFAVWRRVRDTDWQGYGRYTLATMVVAVVFGAAMIPFIQGAYAGLLERVSVALILQWYAVSGVRLMLVAAHSSRLRAAIVGKGVRR